ncbi:hypothetical protein ACZ87_00668 [Candidatus Erwinia dacicola]|uniref:Uncharacterized protein n=1 Tax=Candidatus Erwinia dacicola TaxID=252393 RepID=A0A328TPK1_9GAMM|nr:hypothetical protein ACZ87_00668 [Candidatus Erwinia dacicola]
MPEISLPDFLRDARNVIAPKLANTPEPFQNLNRYLWQQRWMERCAEAAYLQNVLRGMASHRPLMTALAESY